VITERERVVLSVEKIIELIPHRFPFLLVDRVLEFESNQYLIAIKNVTINEPFFTGHFPVKAVMPGVLIVEALAQAAAILAGQSTNLEANKSLFYLGTIENARFKKIVTPGDQLQLRVDILKRRPRVWKFKGTATVDGEVACTAEIISAEGKVDS
jgi:3-hydroxyacyl-[acyl-carrier-protein] dehydratase